MDYVNIVTTIAAAVTIIYTVKSGIDKKVENVKDDTEKKFEKNENVMLRVKKDLSDIKKTIEDISTRLSKLEGEISVVSTIMNTYYYELSLRP